MNERKAMERTLTDLMTPEEMRQYLRISNNTLRRLMREGLPSLKVGRQFRFDRDKVVERLAGAGVADDE